MPRNYDDMVKYVLGFYGDVPGSLHYFEDWGMEPMTERDIEAIMPHFHAAYPSETENDWIEIDSVNRERIRDMVIVGRGVTLETEWYVTPEQIQARERIKPSWFGFLQSTDSNEENV